MKRKIIICVIIALFVACTSLAVADSQIQAILNRSIKVSLNGQTQEFRDEATNEIQYPITYNNRTYLPLRTVANLVGVDVDYDARTDTALLTTQNSIEYISKGIDSRSLKVIYVDTVGQLLNAIGSNRKIILTSRFYGINVENYWANSGIEVENVSNMIIEGQYMSEIAIDDLWNEVITFRNCKNIVLNNLKLGHMITNETYECEGAVVRLEDCNGIYLNNCSLYGCGSNGIYAVNTKKICVSCSKIYDCTYSGIWLINDSEAIVEETSFFDSVHFSGFIRLDNSKILCDSCTVENIYTDNSFIESFDYLPISKSVATFENCKFANNHFSTITKLDPANITFNNCAFRNNFGNLMMTTYAYQNCKF